MTRDSYTGEDDEPLSLHLYTYCENDGVNAWDPSGRKKAKWGKWKFDVYPKADRKKVKKGKRARAFHHIEMQILLHKIEKTKTYVYMFEKMGTGNRLKAMTLIVKKRKVIAAFTKSSTVPDYFDVPCTSTSGYYAAKIKEGKYNITFEYGAPKGKFIERYRVTTKDGNGNIPCTRKVYPPGEKKHTANGILIHAGGDSRSIGRPWSTGCMLVYNRTFLDFCKKVGKGKHKLIVDRSIWGFKNWE